MTLIDIQPITISLTPADREMGENGGISRQRQNLRANLHNAHGLDTAGWSEHIEGACAEVAAAKWLGRFWSPGERGTGDVGAYQVRWRSKPHYDLIVHRGDDDAAPFILVTGGPLHYRLVGWCWGWAAKTSGYWKDPVGGRPAYFIPQRDLSPMSDLPALD